MTTRISFGCIHDPFVDYVLTLMHSFLGLELLPVQEGAHLTYGIPSQSAVLSIPRVTAYTEATIPQPPDNAAYEAAHHSGVPFPYDLFAAVRFWITDEGHSTAPNSAFDTHERLKPKASVQGRLGLLNTPMVNAYLLHFRYWVEVRLDLRVPGRLPKGRRCVVALSHDVDNPVNPGSLAHTVWLAGACVARRRFRAALGHVRDMPRRLYNRIGQQGERYWLFDEVVDAEARHGFQSTFFFSPTPRFWSSGDARDVPYDLRAPAFSKVFESLSRKGAEVGLHIGYRARDVAEQIRDERLCLERASGVKIHGARHHYWHMQRPFWSTLEAHAAAGLAYDCSVAFNAEPGWRLSMGWPFKPWNPLTGQIIDCVQLPTVVMDGAYFYDGQLSAQQAVDAFSRELDMLKTYESCAAIDWHVRTAYPGSRRYREWGEAYLGILELLAGDSEVEVTTCAEAAKYAMGLSQGVK